MSYFWSGYFPWKDQKGKANADQNTNPVNETSPNLSVCVNETVFKPNSTICGTLHTVSKNKSMPEVQSTWNKSWGLSTEKTNPFCNWQNLFGHLQSHVGTLNTGIVHMRRKKLIDMPNKEF